jgi:hypothetical protein
MSSEGCALSSEETHVALPKLYGAPAYARPPRSIEQIERPVDPDDLPLEVERTVEEQEFASRLAGSAFAPVLVATQNGHAGHGQLEARPFRLSGLTGKLFRSS